jgi:OOP family OmpA-OmpF porin
MQRFRILIFIAVFFSSFQLFAQQIFSTNNKKAIKLFQEADALFRQRQFDPGVKKLHEALEKDPNFVEAHLKLGATYKLYGETAKAKSYFEKACELKPHSIDMAGAYITLGELYYAEGEYEKAKIWFLRTLEVRPLRKDYVETASVMMKKAEFGIQATRNPVTFVPKVMPNQINQFYIHAYPVLTADQSTLIYSKRNGPKPGDDEDIVLSRKVNGQWSDPVSIANNINSPLNEGACTLSGDGKTLVFVSCNRKDGVGSCDLYITYNIGGQWSDPVNMGEKVNSADWDSEPSISADGKTIYFSSLRKGGLGKEDIWVTYKDEKGEWSQASNLGEPVNTAEREVSPFIHADGRTLYYSTTGLMGLGGFDIFRTTKMANGQFGEPKNLGYPVNTAANDASVFITADNSRGFYSVYEKKDTRFSKVLLYEFEVPEEIKPERVSTYSSGYVYDAETKKPIHATINLIDLASNTVIQSVNSDPKTGEYLLVLTEGSEYALNVDEAGYLFHSEFLDFKKTDQFNPMKLDVYLNPVRKGKAVVLNNIFFASSSYALEDKSKTELEKVIVFLHKNPDVKIELGGHTDDVGSDKDNQILSMKRAEAVYKYLVSNGVSAARLQFKGYGEVQPVSDNSSETGRKKNRRIEFKVL